MSMSEREAFEAAMAAEGYELNPPLCRDGTYRFGHYAAGWAMWQAATKAAKKRHKLEMAGVIQIIATHANQLQNFAGNLENMP
jgi:hypothetical protein